MQTIKNDRSLYQTRDKLAAIPDGVRAPVVRSRKEVLACLANGDLNGYTNWSLPLSKKRKEK